MIYVVQMSNQKEIVSNMTNAQCHFGQFHMSVDSKVMDVDCKLNKEYTFETYGGCLSKVKMISWILIVWENTEEKWFFHNNSSIANIGFLFHLLVQEVVTSE